MDDCLYVTNIIWYPGVFDVVLLKLDRPLNFNMYGSVVDQACLIDSSVTHVGPCYVVGWGMHNTSTLLYSNKNLRQAPAQPGQQRATIGLTEYTRFTARNGCFRDHGGPLLCHAQEHPEWGLVQVGVLSHFGMTMGDCDQSRVRVYTRVADIVDWINGYT